MVSLAAHLALVVFGSAFPGIMWGWIPNRRQPSERSHIREIRVATVVDPAGRRALDLIAPGGSAKRTSDDLTSLRGPRWDLAGEPLPLVDKSLQVDRPGNRDDPESALKPRLVETALATAASALPRAAPVPEARAPEPRVLADGKRGAAVLAAADPLPPEVAEIDAGPEETNTARADDEEKARQDRTGPAMPGPTLALRLDRRLRPGQSELGMIKTGASSSTTTAAAGGRPSDPQQRPPRQAAETARVQAGAGATSLGTANSGTGAGSADAIPTVRAVPRPPAVSTSGGALAALGDRTTRQNPAEVPRIYQPRLEPDRFAQAQRIGASAASELAVERAIDWLTRHQDKDGRWNAGIARYADGTPVKGDVDYTEHCPSGETCFGECAYWEADTAVTGLALLTYLGAGYTHVDGRYADNVRRGLDFLLSQQKADGDLRGRSKVVGMYCHAMATLALCEAYALTGDAHLRRAVERAVAFMVSARATDGMAWRYAPGAPTGDTSILGWVVMGLKSAKETGIPIPGEDSVRGGTLRLA